MRRLMLLCCAAMATALLAATVAESALAAEGNPFFGVEGAALTGTEAVEASATSNQVLKGTGLTIECKKVAANAGSQLLTEGLNEETLKYTECAVPGKAACEVRSVKGSEKAPVGTIETEALKSRLEWLTKAAAEEENVSATGTLFEPATGEAGLFVELELAGCGLLNGKHKVSGEVLVENEASAAEAEAHTLTAPTTALKHYWRNEGGSAKEKTVHTFEVTPFGTSVYSGTSSVKLSSKRVWKPARCHLVPFGVGANKYLSRIECLKNEGPEQGEWEYS